MYKKESVSAGGLVARQSSLSHSRALEKLSRSTETEQKKMRSQLSLRFSRAAARKLAVPVEPRNRKGPRAPPRNAERRPGARTSAPRSRLNYSAAAPAAT